MMTMVRILLLALLYIASTSAFQASPTQIHQSNIPKTKEIPAVASLVFAGVVFLVGGALVAVPDDACAVPAASSFLPQQTPSITITANAVQIQPFGGGFGGIGIGPFGGFPFGGFGFGFKVTTTPQGAPTMPLPPRGQLEQYFPQEEEEHSQPDENIPQRQVQQSTTPDAKLTQHK